MKRSIYVRLPIMAAMVLALAGCVSAGNYDLTTPEGVAQYNADLAYEEQMSERLSQQSNQFLQQQLQNSQNQMNQMNQWQVPSSAPITPSGSNTAFVYCRDVTGSIIYCKQIR